MKKKVLIILAAVLFVSCISIMPAMATKIADFNVLDTYITIGESFDVNVSVYDDGTLGDLTCFGFDVDPLSSLTFFSYDGYTIAPDFWDVGSGGNNVGGIYAGSNNAGTDVLLATLSFTAGSTAGTDLLSIKGLYDGWDMGLYYAFDLVGQDIFGLTDITIHDDSPVVPEPATMLLLGTGIVGLFGIGRKRFLKK